MEESKRKGNKSKNGKINDNDIEFFITNLTKEERRKIFDSNIDWSLDNVYGIKFTEKEFSKALVLLGR